MGASRGSEEMRAVREELRAETNALRADIARMEERSVRFGYPLVLALMIVMFALLVAVST